MFDPSMFAGMSSLMSAFFPGAPGGPGLPGGASEEHRTFMAHFHGAFSKLVASSGGGGMMAGAPPAAALPPFDPAALFGGQPAAAAAAPAAEQQPAAAAGGELAAGVEVKQEAVAEGTAGGSPTLAAPASQQQLAGSGDEAQAEANNNSAGEGAEAMQIDGEQEAPAAAAATPQPAAAPLAAAVPQAPAEQPQQAAQQAAQPACGAPADAPSPGTLHASGSGTALAPAAAAAQPAAPRAPATAPLATGLTPEQSALQQQALYIGQVMMSLASVFPGMAAAISAMCGMAAAAGFTGPQLPPVSVAGWGWLMPGGSAVWQRVGGQDGSHPCLSWGRAMQRRCEGPACPTAAAQPAPSPPNAALHPTPLPQGMQPAFELPPAGPAPFVQTTFGEVLAARVAGTAPRGSPFCTALQADGELLPGWAGGAVATSHLHARSGFSNLTACNALLTRPPAAAATLMPRAGLPVPHSTPLKSHGAKHHTTPLEARTPISAQAARSGAGRRPLSADTGTLAPEGGLAAAEGKADSNPLAFLAIAASMDDE